MRLPTKIDHNQQLFHSHIPLGTKKALVSLSFLCSVRAEKGQVAAILLQSGTLRPSIATTIAIDKRSVARVKPLTAQRGGTRPCRAATPPPRDRNHTFFPRFGKNADQTQLFHFNWYNHRKRDNDQIYYLLHEE